MSVTPKQLIVYDEIKKFVAKHKYSPTVRELAEAVGLKSSSTAHGYLQRLKTRGYIDYQPEQPRTIKLLKK